MSEGGDARPPASPPAPADARIRSRWIALIAALALVRGLVWSAVLPPWYGPDEISHFDYVQVLALTGRAPGYAAARDDGLDVPAELRCSGVRMGFLINGPFLAHPQLWGARPVCPLTVGDERLPEVATTPSANYAPLYYSLGVPFWYLAAGSTVEQRDHAVRLLSVLLGVAAAVFALLAAWEAFSGRLGPALTAALVFALQPMSAQQFAVVNNDSLLLALAAAFFWRLFRAVRGSLSPAGAAVLGGLAGLAFVAKPQGAFLVAGLAIPLGRVLAARGFGSAMRTGAAAALLFALPPAVVAAGALATHGTVSAPLVGPPDPGHHSLRDYAALMSGSMLSRPYWLLIISAWGEFGWLTARLPRVFYWGAVLVSALALAGAALDRRPVIVTAALTALAGGVATLGIEAMTFRSLGALPLQGRSFLFLLVPAAVLAVATLERLPRAWAPAARAGLGAFCLMACVAGLASMTVAYLG